MAGHVHEFLPIAVGALNITTALIAPVLLRVRVVVRIERGER